MATTFSAVIPTFNRSRLLQETLDSLLAQKLPFNEIIVVDDGSTDDTSEIMASVYPHCRYIGQKHGHVQRARNAGIAAATADWVVICDSDDLLVPDYLADVNDLIGENASGLDAIYCNHSTFDHQGVLLNDRYASSPEGFWNDLENIDTAFLGGGPGFAAKLVGTRGLLWPTGLVVKRSFFSIVGRFDDRMAGLQHEDFEFTLRVVASGRCAFIKAPIACIRQHELNFTSTEPLIRTKHMIQVLQFALDNHPHAQIDPLRQALVSNLDRHRHNCLFEAFRFRDWQTVRSVAAGLRGKPISAKERLKVAIAKLPEALGNPLHTLIQRMMAQRTEQ